jgi:hypothetical protein
MSHDIVEQVKTRKNYYRNNYRASLRILMYCLIIIFCLLVAIIFMVITKPEPGYYASSNEGKVTQINYAPWGSRIVQPNPS